MGPRKQRFTLDEFTLVDRGSERKIVPGQQALDVWQCKVLFMYSQFGLSFSGFNFTRLIRKTYFIN